MIKPLNIIGYKWLDDLGKLVNDVVELHAKTNTKYDESTQQCIDAYYLANTLLKRMLQLQIDGRYTDAKHIDKQLNEIKKRL